MSVTNRSKRNLRLATIVAVLAVSGLVFATTGDYLFSIFVDPDGKTDDEVEQEVHDQLVDDGVQDPQVEFERDGDESRLEIEGHKGAKHFKVVREEVGDAPMAIEVQPPQLDTEREPGMTDAELEAKIQAQLAALGLGGEVTVEGDHVQVRVEKEVEDCGEEPCPPDEE